MSSHFTLSGNCEKDHELLSRIAKENETEFEKMRRQIIDDFISSAPEDKKHRLNCTQWKVDQLRLLANNPVDAYLKISTLMWDSLNRLGEEQQKLVEIVTGNKPHVSHQQHNSIENASILPFPQKSMSKK